MDHSPMYEKIKNYYEKGYWTADMVYNAYMKGKITLEEYREIIGEN